jgi:antitoxin component of RelBE/YafQ-DinJ toxin-antitoxin module
MKRNVTISIDEDLLEKAQEVLRATGKTVNQGFREYLQHIAGETNLEHEIEAFRQRAGQGNSQGWQWHREEAYERRPESHR